MPSAPSNAELQAAINASTSYNSQTEAAMALGLNRRTYLDRLTAAKRKGIKPSADRTSHLDPLEQIRRLEKELKQAQSESADSAAIKRIIGGIASKTSKLKIPSWMVKTKPPSSPGVPLLFLSDLHWGEVVHSSQINGVNTYNTQIAHDRLKAAITGAFTLLDIVSQGENNYPGIVIPLGGDMVSGDIHEELAESNDMHTIPTVLDLHTQLVGLIRAAADKYGHVFCPCVSGNHGRNTKKIRAKDRNHTSFDWLLYQLLARHFEGDKRITFYIPDGSDASFSIYGTKYLLTHGDQFRGGDSMIGCLGPITRGDHKKRSRNAQIDLSYDVMICGHWHQYIHLTKLIVNGSLKGYDEFAYTCNFGFERPQQALWITHPVHGITFRMPVYVDKDKNKKVVQSWVSIPR